MSLIEKWRDIQVTMGMIILTLNFVTKVYSHKEIQGNVTTQQSSMLHWKGLNILLDGLYNITRNRIL